MPDPDAVPINAFFDSTGTRPNESADFDVQQTLLDAEVILGRDVMSGDEFILFGRDAVLRIASGHEPEGARTLRIELDRGDLAEGSEDLARALALVEAVKGSHDYVSPIQGQDDGDEGTD
ncbi:MAG TPA: hypothetical protein VGM05_12900 [Planctomycetaceae bacterium]|jgi:hypothetical protein